MPVRTLKSVLDWENSRESNSAQTAEQHPENGIDTNLYYTAIEDAYFGMKNSDAHDVWLSYKSNYQYYYNHDAAAGTALTADGIDSGSVVMVSTSKSSRPLRLLMRLPLYIMVSPLLR